MKSMNVSITTKPRKQVTLQYI